MAKDAPVSEDEGWEEVSAGIGEQWDFDKGPLVGFIIGKQSIELPERSWSKNPDGSDRKSADVWRFALPDTGEEVFIWDSYALSEALTEPGSGDMVRVTFEGYRDFDGGKKRVKKYKVAIRK